MSGHEHLAQALAACGRDGFTGELRITGTPGGTFHFGDGRVVAVESPGAPGPEALLLRSGRVSGEQWAELVRESGGSRWPATALIAHGYAGAAQLRVVCALALHDAVFAMAAGRVEDCERRATAEPFAQVPWVSRPCGCCTTRSADSPPWPRCRTRCIPTGNGPCARARTTDPGPCGARCSPTPTVAVRPATSPSGSGVVSTP